MPAKIFVVHRPDDKETARRLQVVLYPAIKTGTVVLDGFFAHSEGQQEDINRQGIEAADIILLLVNADALVECDAMFQLAITRAKLDLVVTVPILLSQVYLDFDVMKDFISLPADPKRPYMTSFSRADDAWFNVVEGILAVVRKLPKIIENRRKAREHVPDPNKVQMLFSWANPGATAKLQISSELGRIRARLSHEDLLRRFEITELKGNADASDVAAAIRRLSPQVVHFSGHGRIGGGLLFQGLSYSADEMAPEQVKNLFKIERPPQLVVLNSCHSAAQADALLTIVDAVVGYQDPVRDDDAILFAAILYTNLAAGLSVQSACDQAEAALDKKTRLVVRGRPGVDLKQLTLKTPAELRAAQQPAAPP